MAGMTSTTPSAPPRGNTAYLRFAERLRARERYEPPPRSRGKEKLAGMLSLLERLNHPERHFRVVHIAGTNGKGMTAAMVAGLLAAGGARVGIYTSPHLMDVRERIVLDGLPIAEAEFQELGDSVLDIAQEMGGEPYLSYFDLLTAMGLLAFRRAGVEWAVLEVGLGGFSDATNTTEKALAIVTRLGMDHMAVLGNTLHEIAGQKLGIVRAGTPTVLAPQLPELQPWLERRIAALGSTPVAAPPLVWELTADTPGRLRVWPAADEGAAVDCAVRRAPPTRLECAATALAAAELLLGPARGGAMRERLRTVLATAAPGRLDCREQLAIAGHAGEPFALAVLDGGHNAPALQALQEQLQTWGIEGYTLIFGMQKDKLVKEVREPLARLFGRARRIITLPPVTPRAPDTGELHGFIRSVLGDAPEMPELLTRGGPRAALLEAARRPREPLVISGSFWMLGDLMAELELRECGAGPAARGDERAP